MRSLKNRFSIRNFVETGTAQGHTAIEASDMFEVVHTIENSSTMYPRFLPELKQRRNVVLHLADSVVVLPRIVSQLEGNTVFFLDSHWVGAGEKLGPECPLLDELEVLAGRSHDVVIVDDARLFIHPPPPPHDPAQWPGINQLLAALRRIVPHACLLADSIVATPKPLFVVDAVVPFAV